MKYKQVVAIAADSQYLTAIETLIKSIAYHHHDVTIYLLNEDIPQEWFFQVNTRLKPINIVVNDLKFDPAILDGIQESVDYISQITFGRLLIPKLIPEDRVLYLDADTIVDRNLDPLFQIDLHGCPIGAANEYFDTETFNAGVMLMDTKKLRQDNFVQRSLKRCRQENEKGINDQIILNEEFKNNFFSLPPTYNAQIGGDLVTTLKPKLLDQYERLLAPAKPFSIIHYTTVDKPWHLYNCLRLRDKWWQYHDLDYQEIVDHSPLPVANEVHDQQGSLYTFTNDENLKDFYQLATNLPKYKFSVAAATRMGAKLLNALRYPNVRLHPAVSQHDSKRLIDQTDCYLDINYGDKNEELIHHFLDAGIDVVTFDEVATDQFTNHPHYHVFSDNDLTGFMKKVKDCCHQPKVSSKDN